MIILNTINSCAKKSEESQKIPNHSNEIVDTETPVTETPVTETPVTETPVTETPVPETPQCTDEEIFDATSSSCRPIPRIVLAMETICMLDSHKMVSCQGTYLPETNQLDVTMDEIFATLGKVKDLASGRFHFCAIDADDDVVCWGFNRAAIGSDIKGYFKKAILPNGFIPQKLALGTQFSCALSKDGQVACWGSGYYGRFEEKLDSATLLPLSFKVEQLVAGDAHICALDTNNTVWCWGHAQYGQLGVEGIRESSEPKEIKGLDNTISLYAKGGFHSCDLDNEKRSYCWGDNYFKQLDPENNKETIYEPIEVKSRVAKLSLSVKHSCFIDVDKKLFCYGKEDVGILGDGSNTDSGSKTNVAILPEKDFLSLATALHFSCGLDTNLDLYCWGQGIPHIADPDSIVLPSLTPW